MASNKQKKNMYNKYNCMIMKLANLKNKYIVR